MSLGGVFLALFAPAAVEHGGMHMAGFLWKPRRLLLDFVLPRSYSLAVLGGPFDLVSRVSKVGYGGL